MSSNADSQKHNKKNMPVPGPAIKKFWHDASLSMCKLSLKPAWIEKLEDVDD